MTDETIATQEAAARLAALTGGNPLLADAGSGVEVRFDGVVKRYGGQTVLPGLDLTVRPGEFLALLGPSGCGKSTALRLLAGLEFADAGAIVVGGRDMSAVPTNRRDLGMVFQAYSLFPHMTVAKNTGYGLRMRKVPAATIADRVRAALELVGLDAFAERYPHQLSGGQQQRVALARALVTEPSVLLLDEPLSALDAKVRVQLRDEIRRIQLRLGITTIFVTHDQEEALAVADRIAVMHAGGIEQIGTPEELYSAPATAFVAEFIGRSSIVPAVVAGGRATVLGAEVALVTPVADGPGEVFLRPEQVRFVGADDGGVAATVVESSFLGSIRRTQVRTVDGVELVVQHPADERMQVGDRVAIAVHAASVAAR